MRAPGVGYIQRRGFAFVVDCDGHPDTLPPPRQAEHHGRFMARLINTLDRIFDATLALVYPQVCAACGTCSVERRADWPACAACWAAARLFKGDETLCWECGAPAGGEVPEEVRPTVRCRRCDAEEFTVARACGLYEGALRASVLGLKRDPFMPHRLA